MIADMLGSCIDGDERVGPVAHVLGELCLCQLERLLLDRHEEITVAESAGGLIFILFREREAMVCATIPSTPRFFEAGGSNEFEVKNGRDPLDESGTTNHERCGARAQR